MGKDQIKTPPIPEFSPAGKTGITGMGGSELPASYWNTKRLPLLVKTGSKESNLGKPNITHNQRVLKSSRLEDRATSYATGIMDKLATENLNFVEAITVLKLLQIYMELTMTMLSDRIDDPQAKKVVNTIMEA